MDFCDVVIIGGGPAGSSCAWRLQKHGIPSLILDARVFPRPKPCAGWITPAVVRGLEIDLSEYPHGLVVLDRIRVEYYGNRKVHRWTVPTLQYSIRRYEFDHWLLQRSRARVQNHRAAIVRKDGDGFVIDDEFRCRYLVGAGGTLCPVHGALFKPDSPRAREFQVGTLEEEFRLPGRDPVCRLWFLENGLPGYSWYVPKGNDWVNVGIGAITRRLQHSRCSLQDCWRMFTEKLGNLGLVAHRDYSPTGYTYYMRAPSGIVGRENCFLVGDSAGLATSDLGEGIGPAVESGIRAADAIATGGAYSIRGITRYSWPGFARQFLGSLFRRAGTAS